MCGVCVHVVRVRTQCVCLRPEEDIGYPVLSLCTLFPGDSASHWPEAACSARWVGQKVPAISLSSSHNSGVTGAHRHDLLLYGS